MVVYSDPKDLSMELELLFIFTTLFLIDKSRDFKFKYIYVIKGFYLAAFNKFSEILDLVLGWGWTGAVRNTVYVV